MEAVVDGETARASKRGRRKNYRISSGGGKRDIFDLAADIVGLAVAEWKSPTTREQWTVCFGDPEYDRPQCEFCLECYPFKDNVMKPDGDRYKNCKRRLKVLKIDLQEFFWSPWFDLLCGSVDPADVRAYLEVPRLDDEKVEE